MREMLPYVTLIRGKLLRKFLLGLSLACLAGLAAVGLVGLSGWFIATSALVGLLGITTFSFLFPSGGVRAFALLRSAARYGERVVNHKATFVFLARLRVLAFARASRLPLRNITRYRSGDLLTRLMADIDTLDQLLVRILIPTLSTAMVVLVSLIFLAGYSAILAACTGIIVIAAGVVLPLLMARLGRRSGVQFVEARAEARTRCVEALQGRREIASYQAEPIVRQQVGQALTRADEVQSGQLHAAAISSALMSALASTALLATLLISVSLVTKATLSGPIIVMLYLVVMAVFECIEGLPQAYQFLGQTRHAARRLNALLPAMEPAPAPSPAQPAGVWQQAIRVEQVSFHYDEQRAPVFEDFTCLLPLRSLVAVTGPSGAGKSTLLKLLARELEPGRGTIALGETPLACIQAQELYRRQALISQDSHIFNASLRENLLMAKPDATEQEMRDVLEAVCLTSLLDKLADGLDTSLGEQGEMLSGGERRRLSLAQALLKLPSLLLLDEPTTGVDRETAQRILATLRARLPQSTIVVATHEAWLASLADHHVVLPA
ncbi:MAG TPA: thiol reductant ABC exporter subunit CydC [Ktedonobacteraceae bacterium]|nr:thiol reductant ABC exporter subunit CydC [Ktedonobacteraceae bacterium]